MHVCNCSSAYLVVWTPKSLEVIEVEFDNDFVRGILPKLKVFYFEKLLPVLAAELWFSLYLYNLVSCNQHFSLDDFFPIHALPHISFLSGYVYCNWSLFILSNF